ncbi:LptE family protein [candidate division CSSED10-310 bacterium]|uniref:LptE family protein n=1 Tax=candidate division CSSED10-310 bacterium TaxID=2855610 RepID=A0ABV6YZ12_UNCC1
MKGARFQYCKPRFMERFRHWCSRDDSIPMWRGPASNCRSTGNRPWGRGRASYFWLCLALITFLTLTSVQCGYRLVGQGISLPSIYWKIAIPVFENRTPQQDLEQLITLAIIDTFSRRRELSIVREDEATAVLKGIITSYQEQPQDISSSSLAKSYRIFITASVQLIDAKTKKIIWQDKRLYFSQDYDVSEYIGETEFAQSEARKAAAEDFAQRLGSIILEGF